MSLMHFNRNRSRQALRGHSSRRLHLERMEERTLLAFALWDLAINMSGDPDPFITGGGTGFGKVEWR